MKILGLTGSLAMGKSTIAEYIKSLGIPTHDADASVHYLLEKGAAGYAGIAAAFPDAIVDDAVDRKKLGAIVFADGSKRSLLESILHPLVREMRGAWLKDQEASGAELAVLDIPLLYETGAEAECDKVLVVTCDAATQKARAMAREGMNEEKFNAIIAAQMDAGEKRARADYVIDTGGSFAQSERQFDAILKDIKKGIPHARNRP